MAKSLQRRLRGYISGVEGALVGKPKWRTKPGTIAAIVLLILISVGQLLRLVFQVKVIANGYCDPPVGKWHRMRGGCNTRGHALARKRALERRGGPIALFDELQRGYSSSKPSVFI